MRFPAKPEEARPCDGASLCSPPNAGLVDFDRGAGFGRYAETAGNVLTLRVPSANVNGRPEAEVTVSEQALDRLSRREREVLALVAAGLSNKEIAQALTPSVSVNTVKGSGVPTIWQQPFCVQR